MDFHKTRTWQVVAICEKAAGFWPFQNKIRSGIICLFSFTVLQTVAIPLVVRMLREWGQNVDIVVENVGLSMLLYGTSFKVWAAYFYRSTRARMYKRIMKQLKKLDDEELIIIRSYINYGLKFTLAYITFANIASVMFDLPPMFKMIFSIVFGDGSYDREFPYNVDYYVDNDKYYECMVLHLTLAAVCSLGSVFAYDLSFVVAVEYTCAQLNIATRRLRKASEVAAKYRSGQGRISTDSEHEAHRLLTTAIDIHDEAFQMITLIDDACHFAWFFKLIETVITTGALLTMLTLVTKDLHTFVGYLIYLAFTLLQFNVAFSRGQRLVDHVAAVFDVCYDLPWDDFSKKSITSLRMIMIRSFKINPLTGGKIFPLINVTYMNMLKTAFSYFTLMRSYVEAPTQ